jgi:formylglycine-generating enzyme required for sulfatase activity
MKTQSFVLLGVILIAGCFVSRKIRYDEQRKIPKQKLVPFGTVWLRDSMFIDITETRNLDYLEFLYWMKRNEPGQYAAMLPDTNVWGRRPELEYYLRHPAYADYPVVGISYTQALRYCTWRSKVTNNYYYIKTHGGWKKFPGDTIGKIDSPEYVEYRLPTKEEWEFASAAGHDLFTFPYGYQSLVNSDNLPVSVTTESVMLWRQPYYINDHHWSSDWIYSSDSIGAVTHGAPNAYGVYHLLGNTSELIADSLFKGLNYTTRLDGTSFRERPAEYQRTDSSSAPYDYTFTFRYAKPERWLGFRCVCVVKQLPE